MKTTDKDGNEIEVMTPAEVQAKLDEAVAKATADVTGSYEAKFVEVNTKLSSLETEKKALEDKINGGGGDDHPNFKVLKEALDRKETEIKGLTESIAAINSQRVEDYLGSEIKKAALGDDDTAKKIRFHFDETLKAMPSKSQAEIVARIEAAKTLAGVTTKPNPMDGVHGGGHFSIHNNGGEGATQLTDQDKTFGRKFGLSEEDYKKYGPKVRKDYGK